MRQIMSFHPEWGCLAPAPSFMRTVRAVLVATSVGATAGGGVVFAFVDHSAGDQASVAERTLVPLTPAASTSVNAAQIDQLSPHTTDQSEAKQLLLADSHAKNAAAIELDVSAPARAAIVAMSDEIHIAASGASAKTAVAPLPTQARQKRIAQRARHKDVVRSSRQPQRSLAARSGPNALQRFFAGLTGAVEHVWPLATSTANPPSRARGNRALAATT
jgi:hypothetical protein